MRARISDEQCKHYIFLKLLLRRRRHKKPSNFPFLKSNDDWIGRQRYSKKNCVLLNTKIAGDVRLQHSGYFNPRYHSRMRYNRRTKQKKLKKNSGNNHCTHWRKFTVWNRIAHWKYYFFFIKNVYMILIRFMSIPLFCSFHRIASNNFLGKCPYFTLKYSKFRVI